MNRFLIFLFLIFFLVIGFELYNIFNINEGFAKKIAKKAKKGSKGIWSKVKKPVSKELKKLYSKIFKQIKGFFIDGPLSLIKNKRIKEFFDENVNTNGNLGKVIKDFCLAIVKAIFLILVMVPVLTFFIGSYIIPILSAITGFMMSFFTFFFTTPL